MKSKILSLILCACLLLPYTVHAQPTPLPSTCQVYFSPDDGVAAKLVSLIAAEKKSVRAAVYCLTHREIAEALIDAHRRGVLVEVIVDPFSVKARSPVRKMGQEQMQVFVWNPAERIKETKSGKKVKQRKPLMHDKFCVLGDSQVWTGSFNFTFEASRSNRENVLVLNDPLIAAQYLAEFEAIRKQGCVSLVDYLTSKEAAKGAR